MAPPIKRKKNYVQGHALIGGDFNLVRFLSDKSNGIFIF
jgi:hypothetical protein